MRLDDRPWVSRNVASGTRRATDLPNPFASMPNSKVTDRGGPLSSLCACLSKCNYAEQARNQGKMFRIQTTRRAEQVLPCVPSSAAACMARHISYLVEAACSLTARLLIKNARQLRCSRFCWIVTIAVSLHAVQQGASRSMHSRRNLRSLIALELAI
jgi:hypothetical protein